MALLSVQQSTITGLVPSYTGVSASDTFPTNGKTFLYVKNAGGSPDTVTIDSVTACNQGADHDGGGVVTNGTEKCFGPFDPGRFMNASGLVTVTHSFTTSVTCAVVSL